MKNQNFEEYMVNFKKMSLKEKQDIVIKQLKMLSALTNTMCQELNVKNEIIINKELLDVEKEGYTADDFAEAIIILINSIQNSLCDFDLKLSEIFESNMQM